MSQTPDVDIDIDFGDLESFVDANEDPVNVVSDNEGDEGERVIEL